MSGKVHLFYWRLRLDVFSDDETQSLHFMVLYLTATIWSTRVLTHDSLMTSHISLKHEDAVDDEYISVSQPVIRESILYSLYL